MLLKRLPLGTSDFRTLRTCGELYVDKTASICRLARERGKFLLVRPGRFGKSLLVSTFESLFSNGVKAFRGLAIEALWHDKTYPVVWLDFSGLKSFESRSQFSADLRSLLQAAFLPLGFQFQPTIDTLNFIDQLKLWLASQPPNSLVILIDEYDAPLTAHLDDSPVFECIRDCLEKFYAALKEYEGRLRFFFMTGITKFSSTSIFSAFNNLQDISLDPLYGNILGYTDEEVRTAFGPYLTRAAEALGMPLETLLSKLKDHYDGFSFDEEAKHHVYCPWSVLNFLSRPDHGFQNY